MTDTSTPWRITAWIRTLPRALYHPAAGLIVLFTSLVLTGLAWYLSLEYSSQRESDKFAFQVEEIESAVRQRMDAYARVLQGGVALYNSSESVERHEWKSFIESLDLKANYPGTQGIGVSLLIKPDSLQQHIESVRALGFPDYDVRPSGQRDLYTSIVYLEPFDWRNQRAFGFDMYSEAMRRRAMDRAATTGQPSISSRVTLVQETDRDVQAGFLMYLPIYTEQLPADTWPAERRAKLQGYVYAVLRGADLMQNILTNIGDDITLQLYDTTTDNESLLYQSRSDLDTGDGSGFSETRAIEMYGQNWLFRAQRDFDQSSGVGYWQSTIVGFFGLLIDFLLFYTIHLIGKQRRATDQKQYTANLERANAELRRANENLENTNTALEKSNGDLVQFAYSASHDLKSPLRAISSLAGFVQEDSAGVLSETSTRHLTVLQARTVRLAKLLDDMMNYARIGSGDQGMSDVDMHALSRDILAIIDIPDHFEISTDIDMPVVSGNASPLRQVLMNLITNSIKHHDQSAGKVEIRARFANGRIECTVSDDGPGVPETSRQRVFEMFKTLESRDKQEGSGMGLAFVRKLINTNGGTISMKDSARWFRGTSVHFTWPAEAVETRHAQPAETKPDPVLHKVS